MVADRSVHAHNRRHIVILWSHGQYLIQKIDRRRTFHHHIDGCSSQRGRWENCRSRSISPCAGTCTINEGCCSCSSPCLAVQEAFIFGHWLCALTPLAQLVAHAHGYRQSITAPMSKNPPVAALLPGGTSALPRCFFLVRSFDTSDTFAAGSNSWLARKCTPFPCRFRHRHSDCMGSACSSGPYLALSCAVLRPPAQPMTPPSLAYTLLRHCAAVT